MIVIKAVDIIKRFFFLLTIAVVAFIIMFTVLLLNRPIGRLLTVSMRGFDKIGEYIYVDQNYSNSKRDIQKLVNDAYARIENFLER